MHTNIIMSIFIIIRAASYQAKRQNNNILLTHLDFLWSIEKYISEQKVITSLDLCSI